MSVRKTAAYRITMIVLSLACLAGAGFIVYQTYFSTGSAEKQAGLARQRFGDAVNAEKAGKPAEAVVAYDEAGVHAENGLNAIEEQIRTGASRDDSRKLQAELRLIRSRSARDSFFAKAIADGKPIEPNEDSISREKFRTYTVLKGTENLGRAIVDLRFAFDVEPNSAELAKECLRLELALVPIEWEQVAKVCKEIVKATPNDPRANYCLARHELQRVVDNAGGDPAEAEKWLTMARNNGSPLWRTAWLELQLLGWKADEARKRKADKGELAQVRRAVFGGADNKGWLDRAGTGEAMDALSSFDAEGLFGLYSLSLRLLLADPVKPPTPAELRRVCDSALSMANKIAVTDSKDFLPQAGAVLADVVATSAQPLSSASRSDWEAVNRAAGDFFAKYPAAVSGTAAMRVAQLTAIQAAEARARGELAAANELQEKALTTLNAGLKAAVTAQQIDAQIDYHVALLEVKTRGGEKADALRPHVTALRDLRTPRATGVADYFDAELAVRQGALDRASRLLEKVWKEKAVADYALRARAELAMLALSTGDPAGARVHLDILAEAYSRIDTLPALDRLTLKSKYATPDDIAALQVVAGLEAGRIRIQRERDLSPTKSVPGELLAGILSPIQSIVRKMRVPVDKDGPSPDRLARLTLSRFHRWVGNAAEADKLLADLAVDYPRSVDVLRTRVESKFAPAPGPTAPPANARDEADKVINAFLAEHKDFRPGKLFRAEFLLRTARGDEALKYLNDAAQFPDQQDQQFIRLRAGALNMTGQRDEARKLLAALPADPNLDLLLLQAAGTKEERDARLTSAIGRYENNARFQLLKAFSEFSERKFEAAAQNLMEIVELSGVRESARQLLERTLLAYADENPKAAAELADRLVEQRPEEPVLYLGVAAAACLNEKFGEPADAWVAADKNRRTMYAALNRWDQLSQSGANRAGKSLAELGLKRVSYHLVAGNAGLARDEVARLWAKIKDQETVSLAEKLGVGFAAVQLYLTDPNPVPAKAREFLDAVYKLSPPDTVQLLAYDAAIKEKAGDLPAAAAAFERITTQFPNEALGYDQSIRLANLMNKPDAATAWAVKWTGKQPENDLATLALVQQYAATGAVPAAGREADSLVRRIEDRARKAVEKLPQEEQDKRISATRGEANRLLAVAYTRAKRLQEAEVRLKAALADSPKNIAAQMMAGDMALNRKDWTAAATTYRAVYEQDGANGVAANNLAWLLASKLEKPAEAKVLVDAARKRKGGEGNIAAQRLSPEFLDTLGLVYSKLGEKVPADEKAREEEVARRKEMRELFEAATARYTSDPRMHFWLADAYAALGESAKAQNRYRTVVALCERPTPGIADSDRESLRQQAQAKISGLK